MFAAGTRTFSNTTGMTVRCLVRAKDRQHALDDDPRMGQRYENHRLPAVAVRLSGGFSVPRTSISRIANERPTSTLG